MISLKVVLFSLLAVAVTCEELDFPPGFQFGAASASYQVEGGWNVSDKAESIWDRMVHEKPHLISDRSNGDVACDSYHLWKRDIEMAADLGLHFYRMSIAWPRLLPNGYASKISEDGLKYYSNLIDGLLEKGIQPMVTLYHWDLPQSLQDLGGWTNPLIVDWFGDYARVVYTHFADRVKTWITINEPLIICDMAYNTGGTAPGILDPEVGAHLCAKNVLMAHANAWRIYDKEFRPKFHGEVSVANHLIWYEPYSKEDEELTEAAREYMYLSLNDSAVMLSPSICLKSVPHRTFSHSPSASLGLRPPTFASPAGTGVGNLIKVGRYSHSIYSKKGGWPPVIEKIMADNSKAKGYAKSNLPAFTKEEIEFVRGTFDFYAVNHYTSRLIRRAKDGEKFGAFPMGDVPELGAKYEIHPDWKSTTSSWFFVYPEGLRKQILWLRKQYGDIKFIVTENGYASLKGLNDSDRIEYYTEYLKQLLQGIKEDGLNIAGYTAWTLMDNFEWWDGYNSRFGLYEVDFTSPEKTRTPKASAEFYKKLIKRQSMKVYDEL